LTNYGDNLVSFICDVADLLRGPYRPPEYRKVMLPVTVLRRLDCVLEPSKYKVLEEQKRLKGQPAEYTRKMLQRAAKQKFYNTSKYDFERLKADADGLAQNLLQYIHSFSPEVRALFESFDFDAVDLFVKMRKSLGNKRNLNSDEQIEQIVTTYGDFEESGGSKIFDNDDFGYRKITVAAA
jgi:type I restriction-modification system DNA methylase subunit